MYMARDHQQHQRDKRQSRIVDGELSVQLVSKAPPSLVARYAAGRREEQATKDTYGESEDVPDQDDPAEVEDQLVGPYIPGLDDLVRLVHRAYGEDGVEEPAYDDDRQPEPAGLLTPGLGRC